MLWQIEFGKYAVIKQLPSLL